MINDYEMVKKNLYLKAVNRKKNAAFLLQTRHMPFLDLALSPIVFLDHVGE